MSSRATTQSPVAGWALPAWVTAMAHAVGLACAILAFLTVDTPAGQADA